MFKNMLKRSWLSIIRKPTRAGLLVLILFVMANMLLATVSIKNSVDKSTEFAKEKIGGIVYLQPDTEAIRDAMEASRDSNEETSFTQPTISEDFAKGIAESEYIKDYTYSIVANANASSYEVVETAQNERERQFQDSLDSARDQIDNQVNDFNTQRDSFNSQQGQGNRPMGGGGGFNFNFNFNISDPSLGRGDTSVQGINSYAFISDVESGTMKIVEGEAFDESTENGVIISSELAEANDISVGSNITFKTVSEEKEVTLKVIGIYSTSTEDFNYNTIYTNIETAKQFLTDDQKKELSLQNVRYYLASAEDKDAFLAEIAEKYPDLATDNLKLDIDDTSYQTMVGPIEGVGSFSVTMLWIVIVATVAIITLIVVINVKDRQYEMGVLMSIGATRRNIIGQVFVELIAVGTLAFILSLATSQLLAQKMGEGLLQQQIASSEQAATETNSQLPGGGRGLNANGPMAGNVGQASNVEQIDTIDVSAGLQEYMTLFGLGYLILIIAMILPSANILRYQPKTILTGKE